MATEGRRPRAKKKPAARKPRRAPYKGDPAVQIARGRRIAAGRARVIDGKVVPVAYKDLGAAEGISERQAQTIHKRYREEGWDDIPDTAIDMIDHSIDTMTALIAGANRQVHNATCDEDVHAAIKAMRAVREFTIERLKILIATGRMPANLADLQAETKMQQLIELVTSFHEDEGLTDEQMLRFMQRLEATMNANSPRQLGSA